MTPTDVARMTNAIASEVSPQGFVEAREPVRVAARELALEFQVDPYPEVDRAFDEFRRMTESSASLVRYRVERDDDTLGARVTATLTDTARTATATATAAGPDVISASVRAFVAAAAA